MFSGQRKSTSMRRTSHEQGRVLMAAAESFRRFRAAHFILGIFLTLGVSWNARAQGTRVEGSVRDATGAAVGGAKVQLSVRANSYSAETTTDASGMFVFDGVPGASGTLVVTAEGFQSQQQSWTAATGAASQTSFVLQPPTVSQRVVVTAARTSTPMGESPVSTIQLSRRDLQQTPNLTLDDSLRQVPGFSLFRRSSSRIANPTTLGVSLRGLGSGSGPSRVLVLEDGMPLNDPFGSWVYWDRVPNESVAGVEVDEEGASSLYGSEAFAGVVQFLTRRPNPGGISLETSYGNQNTPDLSLWAGGEKGKWEATFSGSVFHTDGYILVPPADRGSVDTKAGSEHGTADLMIGRKIGSDSEAFARGWYFDDRRQNGTPDQTNNIRLGQGALGADLHLGTIGSVALRFFGEAQTYHQTFSSVAADRNSEILVNMQTVPAQVVGGSAVWSRPVGNRQLLVAGFDEHEEIGHSNEILFSGLTGNHTFDTFSGGHQRTTGVFGEDLIEIAPGWTLAASARFDAWRNFDAFKVQQPVNSAGIPSGPPTNTFYAARSYNAFSPRLSVVHAIGAHVSWSASVYRAFRAPTLNELYRSFRAGTVTTDANPELRAERLTGGETGVDVTAFQRRLEVRGIFFFNEVIDPVTNVPCPTAMPLPTCPLASSGTTQQRQNLGRTTAPGFDLNGVVNITNHLQLIAGYEYVNAKVDSAPGLGLAGLWVGQVPHSVLTFQARYDDPEHIMFSVDGRMVGVQFDDAANAFPMGRFFVMDAMASRNIRGGAEVFGAVENLANERYLFAVQGGPEIGLPIAARVGLRFNFPKR
jgi:outer membrane receptor protein involved in Fe transport